MLYWRKKSKTRMKNTDILKGDVVEDDIYHYKENMQAYIDRANYAKGILEPMVHEPGFGVHYRYWRDLPGLIRLWLGRHLDVTPRGK